MEKLSDDELMAELKSRFDTTKKALHDVKMITKKLEEMNRRLRASEQIKSTFVSLVKNEINNPLTSILGLSEQLRASEHPPDMVMTIADMIHKESFSLDFQLRNIFITAELESGEAEVQVGQVNVTGLINDAVATFAHLIKEKHLTCNVDIAEDMMFNTDSDLLSLMFNNLLANAIEFNKDKGKINIKAVVEDEALTVTVQDTGIGVDPTRMGRLFDRFHQSDSGVRKMYKGHGLGLTIIKALLETVEGKIHVEAPKSGGSIFSITLPQQQFDADADSFDVDGSEFFFDDDDDTESF